jgi:hypothetical protein
MWCQAKNKPAETVKFKILHEKFPFYGYAAVYGGIES